MEKFIPPVKLGRRVRVTGDLWHLDQRVEHRVAAAEKMGVSGGKNFTAKVATPCNLVGEEKNDDGVPRTVTEEVDGDFLGSCGNVQKSPNQQLPTRHKP
jgi:hypothetical protein